MLLDKQIFEGIITNAPLISMDFIVKNQQGQILLGKRNNPPAQNFWFVPGGRIHKNETFVDAFKRLTLQELGQNFSLDEAKFIAPYQHFYADSMFDKNVSTHYVVLAYQWIIFDDLKEPPLVQHRDYQWFDIGGLLNDEQVHQFTKDYFVDH